MNRRPHWTALPLPGAVVLTLALAAGDAHAQSTSPTMAVSRCGRITTVAAGESLADVARRCGVTIQDLTRVNARLDPAGTPEADSELLLPLTSPPQAPATAERAAPVERQPEVAAGRAGPAESVLRDAPGRPAVTAGDAPLSRAPGEERASGRVRIAPGVAFVGATLVVHATGFTPGERVSVAIGRAESGYDVVSRTRADPTGVVAKNVVVPEWVAAGGAYRVAVSAAERTDRVLSTPFNVRGPRGQAERPLDRIMELVGTFVEPGGPCPAVRLDDGRFWSLASDDLVRLRPGDRVRVRGTVPDRSVCLSGTTIEVDAIEVIGGGG